MKLPACNGKGLSGNLGVRWGIIIMEIYVKGRRSAILDSQYVVPTPNPVLLTSGADAQDNA